MMKLTSSFDTCFGRARRTLKLSLPHQSVNVPLVFMQPVRRGVRSLPANMVNIQEN